MEGSAEEASEPRACGPAAAGDAPADPSCGAAEATLIDDPETPGEIVLNTTIEESTAELRSLVGQFACGMAPVYRGEAAARRQDGEGKELKGSAVASVIDVGEFSGGFGSDEEVPHLIVSSSDDVHTFFRQPQSQPGTTQSPYPADFLQGDGLTLECNSCVPDLTQPHASFDFELRAASSDFTGVVEASVNLTRLEPEDVEWSDIETLAGFRSGSSTEIVDEFVPCGSHLIRDFNDRLVEPAPTFGSHLEGTCFYYADYTARWWVDTENLARHGVGNLEISSASHCCGGVEGAGEDCVPVEL